MADNRSFQEAKMTRVVKEHVGNPVGEVILRDGKGRCVGRFNFLRFSRFCRLNFYDGTGQSGGKIELAYGLGYARVIRLR